MAEPAFAALLKNLRWADDNYLRPSGRLNTLIETVRLWVVENVGPIAWTPEQDTTYMYNLAVILNAPDSDEAYKRVVEAVIERLHLAIDSWAPIDTDADDPIVAAENRITALVAKVYNRGLTAEDAIIMITATTTWLLAELDSDQTVPDEIRTFSDGLLDMLRDLV